EQLAGHAAKTIANITGGLAAGTDWDNKVGTLALQLQHLLRGQGLGSVFEHHPEHLYAGFVHTENEVLAQQSVGDFKVGSLERPASGSLFATAIKDGVCHQPTPHEAR